jgi:hypothetical protein
MDVSRRRQYAAHRGLVESGVRQATAISRITPEHDRSIDPAKADAQWNRQARRRSNARPLQPTLGLAGGGWFSMIRFSTTTPSMLPLSRISFATLWLAVGIRFSCQRTTAPKQSFCGARWHLETCLAPFSICWGLDKTVSNGPTDQQTA